MITQFYKSEFLSSRSELKYLLSNTVCVSEFTVLHACGCGEKSKSRFIKFYEAAAVRPVEQGSLVDCRGDHSATPGLAVPQNAIPAPIPVPPN